MLSQQLKIWVWALTLSWRSVGEKKGFVKSCFLHLRNISKIRLFLSRSDLAKVVNALLLPHLLIFGRHYTSLSANIAYTGTKCFNMMNTTCCWYCWIDFKIVLLTSKVIHVVLQCLILVISWPRVPVFNLRSSVAALLTVKFTQMYALYVYFYKY